MGEKERRNSLGKIWGIRWEREKRDKWFGYGRERRVRNQAEMWENREDEGREIRRLKERHRYRRKGKKGGRGGQNNVQR